MEQCVIIDAFENFTHSSSWKQVHEFVLVVGMFGNLVNIIVFSHQRMKSRVNSLFYWLAIFDFLELAVTAPLIFCFEMRGTALFFVSGIFVINGTMGVPCSHYNEEDVDGLTTEILITCVMMSFHTVTILQCVVIIFWRYVAIVYPLKYRLYCSSSSTKKTVIAVLVLGFASWIPYLLIVQRIEPGDQINISDEFTRSSAYWILPGSIRKWIFIILCVVLRVGLFVVL